MKNYAATGGNPYCKAHYPMPTATGVSEVAPAVDTGAYNQGGDQSTQEAYGQNANAGYEANYGGGGGQQEQSYGGEQQQYGEEPQQEYYEQQ